MLCCAVGVKKGRGGSVGFTATLVWPAPAAVAARVVLAGKEGDKAVTARKVEIRSGGRK